MLSVKYHDIFNYPLDKTQLKKWVVGKNTPIPRSKFKVESSDGFYFIKGRKKIIQERLKNQKYSKSKLKIAEKASKVLKKIPTIKFVGITGSLAMKNASKDSDIDLMVIAQTGRLWTTRIVVYLITWLLGIQRRVPTDKFQKDKLCFNMWLDESNLIWNKEDRNLYTAHEIAQIVPLFNKDKTYETFLHQNNWILDFWPNSVKVVNSNSKTRTSRTMLNLIEKVSYLLQYFYMKNKISREVITPTRALFHPQDWGKIVLQRLAS